MQLVIQLWTNQIAMFPFRLLQQLVMPHDFIYQFKVDADGPAQTVCLNLAGRLF